MDKKRDSFFLPDKKKKFKKPDKEQNQDVKKKQQESFNQNRDNGIEEEQIKEDKKPFDKKMYRLKKYSKKYKLDQWEEQRKKKLLHNYYKDVKNSDVSGSYKSKLFDHDTTDSTQESGRFVRHPDLIDNENATKDLVEFKNKKDPFWKAKAQFNKIKQEKIEKQQEIQKAKEERQQKMQEYKKKKQERFKKLSKKTKKGQPVMTGRLEMLLEKIQKR